MLDLTSGTLELDGTAFGPRTTLDQLRNSGLPIRAAGAPSAGITLVRGSGLVHVDGAPFLPEFYFSGSLPSLVLLRPAVQYPQHDRPGRAPAAALCGLRPLALCPSGQAPL